MLKTFRADPSDSAVFSRAAAAGEWAVAGAFAYARTDIAALPAKVRSEFRVGFLGLASLGRSTFVQVVTASTADQEIVIDLLAQQLVKHFGAPNLQAARRAAAEEVAFSIDLAQQPTGRLIAVERHSEDGDVREVFRVLSLPKSAGPIEIYESEEPRTHGFS